MKGFNFEKNLSHQDNAMESALSVFENLQVHPVSELDKNYVNPEYNKIKKQGNIWVHDILPSGQYFDNINQCQKINNIEEKPNAKTNILDIMMETGTGKTYTYTKTIFELNKKYGFFKFIVVVPTLSIKAGTIDFLKSDSSREHFKEQYGKTIHLHIVDSQKNSKSKKSFMPSAVTRFVDVGNFDKNTIHVMIINAGMINSETMQKRFDKGLFDKYTVPFDALGATKPFMIIDEPHKFGQTNKTWENIQKMKPQFILRYGATFQNYENLIYALTAVDSFNLNLVKGVIGHITEFESGKNVIVKFLDSNGIEATFELMDNGTSKTITVTKKESLKKIHPEMTDLSIENLNKSTVILTNGLEMKKGDKINPYSYAEKLQETMIKKAIKNHCAIEKELLTRAVKIKPLTLFFIDNIDEYRNKNGYIRKTVEQYLEAEVKELLKTENNAFYKSYLEKTLVDIAATHAGYFSKDNTEKDEAIEKEINEILHDKQAMLDLSNPRRFIFSKWTLREGWDNPNVFQICKLRSSGSDISKLQEVGRGLRLPVNEYGNRVKDEQFYLNYFVDFTENDFIDKLVNEINQKSGTVSIASNPEKMTDDMIKLIVDKYNFADENILLQKLIVEEKVIDYTRKFLANGFEYIKKNYPVIFQGVHSNKIRKVNDPKKKVIVRTEKYKELKELWEKLNEKVILEYKFNDENEFKKLFTDFFKTQKDDFTADGINDRIAKVEIKDNQARVHDSTLIFNRKVTTIATMKYSNFLKEIAKMLHVNIKTLHHSIIDAGVDINKYLNPTTLRMIKQNFDYFLMSQAIDKFSIEYKKVSNTMHPTKLTDGNGYALNELASSDIGILFSEEKVAQSYFLESLYYDSELEKENIQTEIEEVIVFTKIPKNSIKIPVAGGKSYSPDFAYVLKFKDGEQKLHLIVETKNINNADDLRGVEKLKIKHAKEFFKKFFDGKVKIEFRTQLNNIEIADIIKDIVTG
ncbi:MAG: type III restriction-modification system endonuclease [Phycisphaerales bacterium]|nr:type III restriction-modification system endonuclease [Phycisphaerales bacterium]